MPRPRQNSSPRYQFRDVGVIGSEVDGINWSGNGKIVVPSPYKRERDQRRSTGTPWCLLQGHPSGSVRPLGEAVPSNSLHLLLLYQTRHPLGLSGQRRRLCPHHGAIGSRRINGAAIRSNITSVRSADTAHCPVHRSGTARRSSRCPESSRCR
jgi:hypothetical protein